MQSFLQDWLEELRHDGMALTPEPGAGANENLWCISLPSNEQVSSQELLQFLQTAAEIRRTLAASQSVSPVTFYAWHDFMAGQLRFSTACSTPENLPFGGSIEFVDSPEAIVENFLSSPFRDGIPLSALKDTPFEADSNAQSVPPENEVLKVWAVFLG